MTEDALISTESNPSASFESITDVFENLKTYSTIFNTSKVYSNLLQKLDQYRQTIPVHILQAVQEDYQKQDLEAGKGLEKEKQNFIEEYQKYIAEKKEILSLYQQSTDRIKELKFRYILGEYTEEAIEQECIDKREELFKQMKRLTWLDEILDLYKIIGKDILSSQEKIKASAKNTGNDEATFQENISEEETEIDEPILSEANPASPLVDSITESDDCQSGFLCIVEGSRKGERIPLISMDLTLGASPNNDIQIDDNGVADAHAQIIYKDNKYYLKNIDLLGRSLVNGMQIKSCILKKGDMVSLGNFKMQVEF